MRAHRRASFLLYFAHSPRARARRDATASKNKIKSERTERAPVTFSPARLDLERRNGAIGKLREHSRRCFVTESASAVNSGQAGCVRRSFRRDAAVESCVHAHASRVRARSFAPLRLQHNTEECFSRRASPSPRGGQKLPEKRKRYIGAKKVVILKFICVKMRERKVVRELCVLYLAFFSAIICAARPVSSDPADALRATPTLLFLLHFLSALVLANVPFSFR